MSDIFTADDGGAVVDADGDSVWQEFDSPEETGTEPEVETEVATDGGSESDEWDWEPHLDREIEIQIDGQPEKLTLKELRESAMRQRDYTRKTQELARERETYGWAKRLEVMLQRNPEAALQALAAEVGINLGPQGDPFEDMDPDERRYAQLEQEIQRLRGETQQERAYRQQQEQVQQIERELDGLSQKYGDAFNADEVLFFAAENGIQNLEAAFRAWHYDQVASGQAAEAAAKQAAAARAKQDEQATAAKRKAAAVSGGTSAAKKSTAPAMPSSLHDAWEQAKRGE